ncbi:response regulator transcription factor [Streptomyces europaeiscabiei]|uniref:Helix-turn-helix transcriptional regulator n=1 Tax=Streptomyces europaeiscabiei TaxID=146819 RepID=A0ABU4NE45_9ACTN|nr:helix-turn-helix transcriptional regulator [Streptomyces europaeiscabiei]MDX2758132.1 helix-turn-helix transcriptional regulator [Streptomyces europaeiscabiei]MDX2767926.1 helix-turn-helix transcriptional regulator [Streptomyces europaeiscabiei]MDX3544278.1 helix-turn-helix transcriptional regulator [Streptomyces europaeiscabiei]MDX3552512.1 helix-turn-helix transcriptional regulator [Streptomyces europaeiscabiei]MDX3672040.1 helix-turn-helix transcriptional regulator [Streptomyces europaei
MAVDSSGRLSARELEILLLAAHGMSDADMSRQLSISPRTVAAHMRSIREKLCAKNRTHLVVTALRAGVLALRTDWLDRVDRSDRPDRPGRPDRLDRLDRLDETFRLTGRSGVRPRPVGVV